MNVNLVEFMRSGRFGELALGATTSETIGIIGHPENYTSIDASPIIWKFGATEFMFEGDKLISIEQKLNEDPATPRIMIETDSWTTVTSFRRQDFFNQAHKLHLGVIESKQLPYAPETTIFTLLHQVRLVFENEEPIALSALNMKCR